MKKIFLLLLLSLGLYANEPMSFGATYGNIKLPDKRIIVSYPNNYISSAGNVYLYKNKIGKIDFISNKKINHIKIALEEAKKYAKSKSKKYFAIDNLVHDVIINENEIFVITDYNVLAFD